MLLLKQICIFCPALPPPTQLELILDGDVKDKRFEFEGNYSIVYNYVNGLPYWKQQNGVNAIWFYDFENGRQYWFFGKESKLGSITVSIVLPTPSFAIWPHQIVDGFEYYDKPSFKLASSSDVTINDCKTAFKMSFNRAYIPTVVLDCFILITDTFLNFMNCPLFKSKGNGKCDNANNKQVCLYDGGDCKKIYNCSSLKCIDDQLFDPCPNYNLIGNGKCNLENYNFICSFDGGDCQTG